METQKDTNIKDNNFPVPVWTGSVAESASRLVRAVYMVTSLFSDSEPLKGHLKMKALNMLSLVVSFMRNESFKSETQIQAEEIMSLIETANVAGLLSTMNRDVLISEYSRFLNLLSEQSSITKGTVSASLQDLSQNPVMLAKPAAPRPVNIESLYKGHSDKGQKKKGVLYKTAVKLHIHKVDNGDRKQRILDILKEKGETTIKDIASGIAGCSEKTIQRDLLELLGRGAVKKRGERRWTIYSLA